MLSLEELIYPPPRGTGPRPGPVNYRHVEGGWTADIDGKCPACGGSCKVGPMPLEDLQTALRKKLPGRGELYYSLRRKQ